MLSFEALANNERVLRADSHDQAQPSKKARKKCQHASPNQNVHQVTACSVTNLIGSNSKVANQGTLTHA
jgi:hypothetical protein